MAFLNKFIVKFIASLIIFQLSIGTELARYASATELHREPEQSSTSSDPASQAFEDEANALALSPAETKAHVRGHRVDPFKLTQQSLEIMSGHGTVASSHSLSEPDLNLPVVTVSNFKTEVTIEGDADRGLTFSLARGGKLIARHRISGIRPLSIAHDQELLTFLDANGKIYAIDIGYARTALMKGPLPVIELVDAQIPENLRTSARAEFLTRNTTPFEAPLANKNVIAPQDQTIYSAGDLIFKAPNSSHPDRLLGVFDRNVIKTQVYTAEAVLSMLAFRVAPRPESEAAFSAIVGLQSQPAVADQTAEHLANPAVMKDPVLHAAFSTLNADAISRLIVRANSNALDRIRPRDQILLSELQTSVAKFSLADALGVNLPQPKTLPKPSDDQRTSFSVDGSFQTQPEISLHLKMIQNLHLAIKPQTLKILAKVAAGAGAAYGTDAATGGHLVHAVLAVYDSIAPAVLRDSVYRVTLLKSSLALGSFIPLLYGVGKFVAKKAGQGWSAQKALAVMSFRAYAAIQLPFWYRLADLARMPNFIRALKVGVNPFKSVETPIGTLRAGLARESEDVAYGAKAISKIAEDKARLRSLAWSLALAVAGNNAGIDPATLGTLMINENPKSAAADAAIDLTSPAFERQWSELAGELYYRLISLRKDDSSADLANLSPQDLAQYYEEAKTLASRISARGPLKATLARLNLKWKRAGSNLLANVAGFGYDEYQFLKTATPDDFVVSQFWKQYTVDYGLAIVQMGLVGSRANLADPSALAASADHFAYTTPGHLTDMADQTRIYALDVPARTALVYQKQRELVEDAYDPIEDTELKGEVKREGVMQGLIAWTKGALDIPKANYAGIFLKGLLRQFRTIQVGILMGIGARLTVGHQAFLVAVPAFFYTFVWSRWQYGWLWEPVNRGNQIYGERLTEVASRLTQAKRNLAQGLRLNDQERLNAGQTDLLALYQESNSEIPDELRRGIETLDALVSGSPESTTEAISSLQRINAQALLEHTLVNPPVATEANSKVEWLTTMFGAVMTTWWATSMSVLSFRNDIAWGEKILEASSLSALIYGGVYVGQKAIEKLSEKIARIRSKGDAGECTTLLE